MLNRLKSFLKTDSDWKQVVVVFLQARVAASVSAALALSSIPSRPILEAQNHHKQTYPKLIELLIGTWERADAMWYLGIAKQGYTDPAGRAFLPLYPFLIRVVSTVLPGPDVLAALLISNLSFLGALYFIYQLALSECSLRGSENGSSSRSSERAALRSITYLAFFPGSLFCMAPYTESLFLLLASASLWSARKGEWSKAAVLGCFLGLTRNLGFAIAIPLFAELIRQWRSQREGVRLSSVLWLAIIPAGLAGWMLWCAHVTGDALAFVHQQSQWQRASLAPWITFWKGLEQAWDYCLAFPGGGYVYEALAMLGALVLGIYGLVRRKISTPLLLWSALTFVPPLLAPYEGRMLMSCTRFAAVIFPVFIVLGISVQRETTDRVIQAGFLAAYGIATAMFVSGQYMF